MGNLLHCENNHTITYSDPYFASFVKPEKRNNLPINLSGFSFLYNSNQEFITDKSCCICFEGYQEGMIMQMLLCNHILHRDCLIEWLRKSNTCPICRCNVD